MAGATYFKAFWTAGPKAPDEKDWLKLFGGDQPVLILLDEMPPYFNYLDTQKVGNGTVADIATRAFACLLTAAGNKKNVCVVVSDLAAAYDTGAKLINRALEDARSELGRQERNITPVDLAANEIYDILRKRLFKLLPDKAEIGDIAEAFGRKLEEAAKSKTAGRGAEAIADEIAATYPFHPRLKNVIALFKENEQFKQTRGLIELVSRLLKSVWERAANDVFLIGLNTPWQFLKFPHRPQVLWLATNSAVSYPVCHERISRTSVIQLSVNRQRPRRCSLRPIYYIVSPRII